MSDDRPKRDSMSLEEATVSNMWEMAAIVEVLERKGLCTSKAHTLLRGTSGETTWATANRRISLLGHSYGWVRRLIFAMG
jgi:hypothetical protein